ncbi:MAG TPA: hypothetical protein VNO30_50065 [Kofleriaceae bacterium]|nr:hypothetical protein [Kofleriaceae bacterium]
MPGAIEELAAHPGREAARAPLDAPAWAARVASMTLMAAVTLGPSLAGGAAHASPPRGGFGGGGLAFGTSSEPSTCRDYCDRGWGPAVEGSVGRMLGDSLAVRGDLWLYVSGEGIPSPGLMIGVQLWPGAKVSLRAELGAAVYWTHNADGGGGVFPGGTAAITFGYELWRSETVAAELELRGMLLALPAVSEPDAYYVTFAFAGYAVRWD